MIDKHPICSDCARKRLPPKPRDDRFQCKNCGKRSDGSGSQKIHEQACDVHVKALMADSSHIMKCHFCRTNRIGLVVKKRKAELRKKQIEENRSKNPIIQPPGTA